MMSQNIENVVKQGYLKKGHYGANRLSVLFRRNDVNKWFVFTIRRGVPFLEYYDSDVDVFTQQPINSFNLSHCQNVRSMGNSNPPSFCIVCPDRVIELVASSRVQMVEWVNEVEASLVRLGILKNEVVDHVYSVCPAVVRKPRVSMEVSEENQPELSSLQLSGALTDSTESRGSIEHPPETMSSSISLPPPPPRSSVIKQRTSSFKPATHATLASRTSSSFHSPHSTAVEVDAPPPPLPARLSSCSDKTQSRTQSDEITGLGQSATILTHTVTDGSNDSDFVSPEVIAELLLQREASKNRRHSLLLDSEKYQSTSDTSPEPSSEIYIDMSRSHTDHNMEVSHSPSPDHLPHLLASTFKLAQISAESSDTSASVDNVCAVYMSPQSPEPLDIAIRSEEAMENTYSIFPCQQETAGDTIDDSDLSATVVHHTQKPVAVPRKTKPKTSHTSSKTASAADGNTNGTVSECSSQWPTGEVYNSGHNFPAGKEMYNNVHNLPLAGEEVYNNLPPTADTYGNLQADDSCMNSVSPSAGTSVLDAVGNVGHDFDSCGDVYINLKRETEYNNVQTVYNNVLHADKDDSRGAYHLPSVKDNHSNASKDENENFYGLVFDTGPPSTRAPLIPPLPSGHYSHSSSPPQDPRTASSSAKNPAASSLVQSAFHAAASNKCASLPSETTPPLLLPRKTNSFHASLPSSSTTDTDSRDVKHKGSNLYHTLSLDDQPPALPSRGSQSFFIKRPQITAISSNKMTSSESSYSQTSNTSLQSQQRGLTADTSRCCQTEQATNVSSLSRKMLLDRAHSLHTVVSLKQTQADILQTEISLPNVTLTITQKAGHGIALVDWNSFSCVVGWNQKDFPSLHGKLHLGDLVFSVNGVRVTSADTAQKLLKQAPSSSIELMLHRMPYAKVFAIHRSAEGQSLGIKRNGGTGEIIYVDPNGLAAQHGLTPYAQSVCGTGRCNWFLVEINNRPLSLFFKDDEIDHRLSAVGREISLVVQPSDFIYEIRRRFKKLRNYKQFITQ